MKKGRIETLFSLIYYLKGIKWYMIGNIIICFSYELLPITNIFLVSYSVGPLISHADVNYTLLFGVIIASTVVHGILGHDNMWTEQSKWMHPDWLCKRNTYQFHPIFNSKTSV